MENYMFLLRNFSAPWLSSSSTYWLTDTILALLCGVGLYFLLLPYLPSDPSLPPPKEHRYIKKHQIGTRGRNKRRKRSGALKVCRDSLQELKETRDLILLLQSHLGQLPDKGNLHQVFVEVCKTVPAGTHLPQEERVHDTAPVVSPLASTAPLTKPPLPLASTLSPYPKTQSVPVLLHSPLNASQSPESLLLLDHHSCQPLAPFPPPRHTSGSLVCPRPPAAFSAPPLLDSTSILSQCDSMSLPLSASPDNNSWLSASMPAISGLHHSSHPTLASSWGWEASKTLFFSTSAHPKFQQEHLSHHSEQTSFRGGPIDRQVEVGGTSFLNPDIRKHLELQITKRVELKIWKEKEKEGSDYHLNSLGNKLKPLGEELDNTIPQPFWSTKGKPGQLPSPEMPPHPETLQDQLKQKCSQLFWGLPFLHSESLVATIRVSGSALEFPSVFFNGISSALPIQMQTDEFSLLSQPQALPHYVVQSQLLIPAQPPLMPQIHFQLQPLAQIQTQVHLPSSFPTPLPPSPPQIVSCRELCPPSKNESQSLIPVAVQHLECHFSKKQQESWQALPLVVKRSQEAYASLSSNLPQESRASQAHRSIFILPGNFPLHPELRKHMEQHLQKRLVQQQSSQPCKPQVSLGEVQPQRKSPRTSSPSVCTQQSSKDIKKLRFRNPGSFHLCSSANFQLGKDPKADLGQNLGMVSKYTVYKESKSSEEDSAKESKNELKKPSESSSGNDLERIPEKKQVENDPKVHVDKKLGQISEGSIPTKMCHSWFSASALPRSDTQLESRKLVSLDGQECCVNTSQELPFLTLDTQQVLEAHVKKFCVKHRWGLLLKVLKSVTVFKLRKVPASSLQHSAFPMSPTHESGTERAEVGKPMEESYQASQEEKMVTTSLASTLKHPLPVPSPAYEGIQTVLRQGPSGDDHKLLEAPLTGQKGRQNPQPFTPNILGGHRQSTTVFETQRGSLGPTPSLHSRERSASTPGSSSPGGSLLEMGMGSQFLRAEESREATMAEGSPALQPQHSDIWSGSELADSPIIRVDLSGLGSPGTRRNATPPRMPPPRVPKLPCPKVQVLCGLETKMKVEPENELQDGPTDALLAASILASQVPQRRHRSTTNGNRSAPHKLDSCMAAGKSSLGQPESKILKPQAPLKSQSNNFASIRREDRREPKPGEHEEGVVGLGSSPTRRMSPTGQARGTANTPSKRQCQPEKPLGKNISHFLQWIFSNKGKGLEEPLQKHKPASASVRGREPIKIRSIYMSKEAAEAQELMAAVGQILEEKIAHQASKLSQQKPKAQVPVGKGSCYHRAPSSSEQRKVVSDTTCNRHDTPEKCPVREKWIRDEDGNIWKIVGIKMSNCAFPPGEPVSPISSYCHWPWRPGESGHPVYCPRHCLLRNTFSGRPENVSPVHLSRKSSIQENMQSM
ncbi:spermatogenesis-associated protein 31A6-like [Tamandua tetradactyla]|uniref:spermatogenesis-associated protein 31A6-like n=1 Tax=Tamandua tetradactyla TaxID=48850 RepID=UPI0040545013